MEIRNTPNYSAEFAQELTKQDTQWIEVAHELYNAIQWRKEWEATEKKLKAQLAELSDHKNAYGGDFKFELVERKGNVDYKFICELHVPGYQDIDLDTYRSESSAYWKLTHASTAVIDAFQDLL
jgi:hypothetical protein